MAQYNADIRIGVTGKAQLNQLEAQLKRTQVQLNKLNKSLQLRTRVQAIRLDTRAANTAIRQLEQRINRLGRTINVNLRVNEKEGRRSSGGGGGSLSAIAVGGGAQATRGIERVGRATKEVLDAELKATNKIQQAEQQRQKYQNQLIDQQKELNDLTEERARLLRDINKVENSANKRARTANQNRLFGGRTTKSGGKRSPAQAMQDDAARVDGLSRRIRRLGVSIADTQNKYGNLARVSNQYWANERRRVMQAADAYDMVNKKIEESTQALAKRQKFSRGFGTGFGVAGASALGNIPLLGDAATGGLVAGLSGGSVLGGAAGGALGGGLALLAQFGAQATETATQVNKLRISLELAAGTDFERSLETINTVVNEFNTPLDQATTSFTKLVASAQGSGIAFNDLAELFINLSAANKAFAGDAEDLNGILRAFTQIISKGTVQSEELKGQVGERLPGAFALAAKSLGLTTAELQKALENGEVKSKDFVEKFGRYMRRFREDAQTIADAPTEAGARLEVALKNLQVTTGQELARLGANFQNFATVALNALNDVFTRLGELGRELENRINAAGGNPTQNLEGYIQGIKNADDAIKEIQDRLIDPSRTEAQVKDDLANLEIWYQSRKDFQAKVDKLKLGPPVPAAPAATTPLVEEEQKKTKGGPRDITAELTAQLALEKELLGIEQQRFGLRGVEGQLREFDLRDKELEAQLENELKQIATENITAESKALAIRVAQLRNARDIYSLQNERANFLKDQRDAFQAQLEGLQSQVAIEEAITEEKKNQLRLDAARAEIDRSEGLTGDQKNQLKDQLQALEKARQANQGVSGYFRQLQADLADTEGMIVSLAQTIEGSISSAMSTAVSSLVTGAEDIQTTLANMFEQIGKAFIDMAAQIITKQLMMIALQSVLKALGGPTGGSGAQMSNTQYFDPMSGLGVAGPNFGLAEGGFVTSPTKAMVGEGGQPEYVIPADRMQGAMSRYSAGMRGDAVVNGADTYENGGDPSTAAGPINFNFNTVRIADEEYVDRTQLQEAMAAAASSGAKQGEARAIRRLQMSPGTRRRTGL